MLIDDPSIRLVHAAMRLCRPVVFLAFALIVAGCVPLEPNRYRLAQVDALCDNATATSEACRHSTFEHAADYDLHFVEFDDQGLQYPDSFDPAHWELTHDEIHDDCDVEQPACMHRAAWAYQINNLIKQLNLAAGKGPITLMVYIHGWKHDARAEDVNLANFRNLLASTALIERSRPTLEQRSESRSTPMRRVVGVYVGWRGQSSKVPYLDNLTFWSRKTAAMHVAEGSSRELFARLRGFKCVQNTKHIVDVSKRDCNRQPDADEPIAVKIVLIGHSFGGLILYNSISASLIESMTQAFDTHEDNRQRYWRFADLAVLINPAFEATRYTPLHRIAASTRYSRYEAPLLVTVTSTTDDATGYWFKLGRSVNTFFEQHVDAEEAAANRETVGHHAPYFTHRLEYPAEGDRVECPGWIPLGRRTTEADAAPIIANDLVREYDNSKSFFLDGGTFDRASVFRMRKAPWTRNFCGGVRLSVLDHVDANVPIWNISAVGDKALLPDHNDIIEPLFIAFIRQLYLDTIFLDDMLRGRRAFREDGPDR